MITVNGRNYLWPEKPVVVVCIDGSEPAYIEEAVRAGVMPWTKKMLEDRGADLRCDCVIPSFTNPNNLSIVTGVEPSFHGICGNYYYDRDRDSEVMMNDPSLLRTPTIFEAFQNAGARVVIITAKDKLRRLLGHRLQMGTNEAICFSSEKAALVTLEENGIENVLDRVGMAAPSVYSAELSELIFAAGVQLMKTLRPTIMYLSTTDYIQHKYPPGSEGANSFYAMMDRYWKDLDALDTVIGMTADHGMNAKHDTDGRPNVIYLQQRLDRWIGTGKSRVILPITDPYVVHHGALGSFATVYLDQEVDQDALIGRLQELEGIELVYGNAEGCRKFGLDPTRLGDIILVSSKHSVIGTREDQHDLSGLDVPLRSHGGLSEQTVPLLVNRPVTIPPDAPRLRNFDVFDVVLNRLHG